MKIIFANPPVLRSASSSPDNDFKIAGHVYKRWYLRIPGLVHFLKIFGVGKGVRYGVRAGSRWPWTMSIPPGTPHYPFIMAYAASLLKAKGVEVDLLDYVGDEIFSYERFFAEVKAGHPDIVVVECSTPTIDIDLWVAKKISAFAKVALAGPHLTFYGEQIARENPWVSYVLKGEYILNSLKMAETLKPGVYESEVLGDMDSVPYPYRDYRTAKKYYDPSMPTPYPQLQIYASKGCPFKCVFCLWPRTMYNGTVSFRRPEAVAAEIRECISLYGYRSIFFDDDTFNIGDARVSSLCDELKEIGLPWTMMGRLDCSPPKLFDKMVESGCVGMRFGVETFDPVVLKRIKKGLMSDKVLETLRYISDKHPDLMIHLTMMKNLPGQSSESHSNDMSVLKKLGYSTSSRLRNYQLASCAPFPGTELYDDLTRAGHADKLSDFKGYDGAGGSVLSRIERKGE